MLCYAPGVVETFALVRPSKGNNFCGVYLYLDEVRGLRSPAYKTPRIKRHVLHKTQPNSKPLAPPQCDCALYDSRATRAYSPHVWAPTLVYGLQRHGKNAIVPSDCARRFLRRNQHLRARPSNVERAGLRGRIQALFGIFKPGP